MVRRGEYWQEEDDIYKRLYKKNIYNRLDEDNVWCIQVSRWGEYWNEIIWVGYLQENRWGKYLLVIRQGEYWQEIIQGGYSQEIRCGWFLYEVKWEEYLQEIRRGEYGQEIRWWGYLQEIIWRQRSRPPEDDFVPEIQMLKSNCACQNVGNSSFWKSLKCN